MSLEYLVGYFSLPVFIIVLAVAWIKDDLRKERIRHGIKTKEMNEVKETKNKASI